MLGTTKHLGQLSRPCTHFQRRISSDSSGVIASLKRSALSYQFHWILALGFLAHFFVGFPTVTTMVQRW